MRVAVTVKYYPPTPRVSGIVGFLTVLHRRLAQDVDLHVISHGEQGPDSMDGYHLHRVRGSFPVASALVERRLRPDATLFVSGIHDLRLAGPYLAAHDLLAPRRRRAFLQATHPSCAPNPLLRMLWGRRGALLAASDGIAEALEPAEFEVFTPGVDLPDRRDRSGPLTIGFVNHLNRVKGADLAFDTIETMLSEFPDIRAIVAGTGELSDDAERRFAGHPRVELAGFLPEERRMSVIADCDLMLLPFRTAVSVLGVSQTVLEVMAAGNVVVGSPTASIEPAIVDGHNGVLADAGDFTAAVRGVVADATRRARLGDNALADARANWSIDDRAASLLRALG